MPNPRYSNQREQERPDPKTKQLQQLAALKQLGGGQQELAQRGEHQKMMMAMQLLGLMQQKETDQQRMATEQQRMAADEGRYWGGELPRQYASLEQAAKESEAARQVTTRGQDLQSGQFWEGTMPQQYAQEAGNRDYQNRALEEQKRYHDASVGQSALDTLGRMPNIDPAVVAQFASQLNPQLGAVMNQVNQQQRAAAIEQVYPSLKLIQDPTAREAHGRAQLGKFPGAYDEALARAFPQVQSAPVAPGQGAAPSQPTNFNPKVDGIKMMQLLQQNDPNTFRKFQELQSIHGPMGKGTAAEGSQYYQYKQKQVDDANAEKARMLAPYLFQLYGQQPINPNQG